MSDTAERAGLVRALAGARNHVLDQVGSMAPDDLRRSRVPSQWSPLGLVRHLTLSDERYWFEVVVAGGPLDFWPPGDNGDWVVGPDVDPSRVIEEYRRAIANADRIIADTALDAPPRRLEPEWAAAGAFPDLRSVLLHVIVETSTHAGQLDVVRELADGGQYIVLATL